MTKRIEDYTAGASVYVITAKQRKTRARINRITKSTIIVECVEYRRNPTKGREVYQGWGRSSREGVKPALSSMTNDGSRIVLVEVEDRRLLLQQIEDFKRQLIQADINHLQNDELGELSRSLKACVEQISTARARINDILDDLVEDDSRHTRDMVLSNPQ